MINILYEVRASERKRENEKITKTRWLSMQCDKSGHRVNNGLALIELFQLVAELRSQICFVFPNQSVIFPSLVVVIKLGKLFLPVNADQTHS